LRPFIDVMTMNAWIVTGDVCTVLPVVHPFIPPWHATPDHLFSNSLLPEFSPWPSREGKQYKTTARWTAKRLTSA